MNVLPINFDIKKNKLVFKNDFMFYLFQNVFRRKLLEKILYKMENITKRITKNKEISKNALKNQFFVQFFHNTLTPKLSFFN